MRRTEWEAWLAFTNPNAAAGSIRTLLGEPGRCFCQDLLLLPKDPTLPTQPAQLIELGGGKPLSVSVVNIGLVHPIADGLLRRFELPAQLTRRATRPHQAHHLRPELRRVRRSRSRHSLNTPLREQSQVIECPPKRVNLMVAQPVVVWASPRLMRRCRLMAAVGVVSHCWLGMIPR